MTNDKMTTVTLLLLPRDSASLVRRPCARLTCAFFHLVTSHPNLNSPHNTCAKNDHHYFTMTNNYSTPFTFIFIQ